MASQAAAKVAQAANRVVPVNKKYTVQSTGIWETIRRVFAVDPTRSNGVPLNPQFRNPPPGSNEPFSFIDPVTFPAGDIAENPYWKRDSRRSYPQLSFVKQGDVVGLLSVGSEASPRKELIGEEGGKELVRVAEVGERGLAAFFEGGDREGKAALEVFGKGGLPPTPSGLSLREGADKYNLTEENAYPEQYPCRTFK
ncbi:31fc4dfe-3740-4ebd-987b-69806bbdbad0 [Sclerotinia trifoliorum]|uniref:31fc4dfe-3740-4ebd-987b-69806bbdbad0 n=1 Tax=Sclerotinia trifoliorum TaxID=28548 RepID=A0A8H2VNA7_9HELO|nr:31fc4dfe-3740-4ebd-987b-69806bbdbad0 [Sclerotinia trifoliorum]